jgi:hypothetical protein
LLDNGQEIRFTFPQLKWFEPKGALKISSRIKTLPSDFRHLENIRPFLPRSVPVAGMQLRDRLIQVLASLTNPLPLTGLGTHGNLADFHMQFHGVGTGFPPFS